MANIYTMYLVQSVAGALLLSSYSISLWMLFMCLSFMAEWSWVRMSFSRDIRLRLFAIFWLTFGRVGYNNCKIGIKIITQPKAMKLLIDLKEHKLFRDTCSNPPIY